MVATGYCAAAIDASAINGVKIEIERMAGCLFWMNVTSWYEMLYRGRLTVRKPEKDHVVNVRASPNERVTMGQIRKALEANDELE